MAAHSNRLINETSPYLLQHAHNPVDWHPWGEEALARARRDNKPILVSIGYSACHWCHVMEQESFENEQVAQVMNRLFVCIKVDREERPDLDKIYQTAHQILTQRPGGWPLNMFLTPDDHMPFFGGTYFPREARHGLPAFTDILQRVAAFYHEQPDAVREQNISLREIFSRIQPHQTADANSITPALLSRAVDEIKSQFDPHYGGFGSAPKFPHPTSLERCLRHWAHTRSAGKADAGAAEIVRQTLAAMAHGGIYDQLGGGFCRYSVDEQWMIPHFEKMLYDNAQLLPLYADAAVALREDGFGRVAAETGAWVMREMQSPQGGYYSTLDADSEGEEGKYYVWATEEIKNALAPEEWAVLAARYGLDGRPNFEGKWNLHVHAGIDSIAEKLNLPKEQVLAVLDSARQKLLERRERRVRPGRDEKILTSWNGLMIKGMAHAGRLLRRPDFVASAERALDFVRATLWRGGRLLATTKDGKSHLNAYLDDYAFLIEGVLALLQARWRDGDLDFAVTLADVLLAHFEDREHGGFYFTSDDHEELVYRPKPAGDEAIPSGNGVATYVLLRLGHLLGEEKYLAAAERTVKAFYHSMNDHPSAHGALLLALEEYLFPTKTVILRGKSDDLRDWRACLEREYAPRRLSIAIPPDATALSGVLAEHVARDVAIAYICSGHTCGAPVMNVEALEAALG